jgi:hypothetical protein
MSSMSATIEYASPQASKPLSRLAVVALALSLLLPALTTGLLWGVRDGLFGQSGEGGCLLMGSFGLSVIVDFALSLTAVIRIIRNSSLKGITLALAALGASILWPVYGVYWFLNSVYIC